MSSTGGTFESTRRRQSSHDAKLRKRHTWSQPKRNTYSRNSPDTKEETEEETEEDTHETKSSEIGTTSAARCPSRGGTSAHTL
eukprot:2098475-Rhodomonas_salina.1